MFAGEYLLSGRYISLMIYASNTSILLVTRPTTTGDVG